MNVISRFHSLAVFLNNPVLLAAEELFTRKIKEHPGENIILIFANRYGKVRPAIFFPDSSPSSLGSSFAFGFSQLATPAYGRFTSSSVSLLCFRTHEECSAGAWKLNAPVQGFRQIPPSTSSSVSLLRPAPPKVNRLSF